MKVKRKVAGKIMMDSENIEILEEIMEQWVLRVSAEEEARVE